MPGAGKRGRPAPGGAADIHVGPSDLSRGGVADTHGAGQGLAGRARGPGPLTSPRAVSVRRRLRFLARLGGPPRSALRFGRGPLWSPRGKTPRWGCARGTSAVPWERHLGGASERWLSRALAVPRPCLGRSSSEGSLGGASAVPWERRLGGVLERRPYRALGAAPRRCPGAAPPCIGSGPQGYLGVAPRACLGSSASGVPLGRGSAVPRACLGTSASGVFLAVPRACLGSSASGSAARGASRARFAQTHRYDYWPLPRSGQPWPLGSDHAA